MPQPARAPAQAPAIELGDFQLTVHRRQFPDAQDRWDGNWLHVTAQCLQGGALVAASGPILEAADVQRFRDELAELARTQAGGAAELRGSEPNVLVQVAATEGAADVRVRVELTPDPQGQGHWFAYALDRSYLVQAIRQLDGVLALFPVRGLDFVPRLDEE
jgi:hypothetical protein